MIKKNVFKIICSLFVYILLSGCGKGGNTSSMEPVIQRSHNPPCESLSELIRLYPNVATFQVLSTKPKSYIKVDDVDGSKSVVYYVIIKIKILEVFKGELKPGENTYLVQLGDGVHEVRSNVIETLGYYEKDQRYLGFINISGDIGIPNQPSEICSVEEYSGQFLINKENEILKHPSEYDFFPDAKTTKEIVNALP